MSCVLKRLAILFCSLLNMKKQLFCKLIFVLSRFHWSDIINKKISKVDGWEIGYEGIGI